MPGSWIAKLPPQFAIMEVPLTDDVLKEIISLVREASERVASAVTTFVERSQIPDIDSYHAVRESLRMRWLHADFAEEREIASGRFADFDRACCNHLCTCPLREPPPPTPPPPPSACPADGLVASALAPTGVNDVNLLDWAGKGISAAARKASPRVVVSDAHSACFEPLKKAVKEAGAAKDAVMAAKKNRCSASEYSAVCSTLVAKVVALPALATTVINQAMAYAAAHLASASAAKAAEPAPLGAPVSGGEGGLQDARCVSPSAVTTQAAPPAAPQDESPVGRNSRGSQRAQEMQRAGTQAGDANPLSPAPDLETDTQRRRKLAAAAAELRVAAEAALRASPALTTVGEMTAPPLAQRREQEPSAPQSALRSDSLPTPSPSPPPAHHDQPPSQSVVSPVTACAPPAVDGHPPPCRAQ